MADLRKLDEARRLTPWSIKDHALYIAGQYGSLLSNPQAAEGYLVEYEKKEKEFDAAYEEQRRLLGEASRKTGDSPQELPDLTKIDWNPREQFIVKDTDEQKAAKELEKAEKKAAKEAEKAAKKAAKEAAKAAKTK